MKKKSIVSCLLVLAMGGSLLTGCGSKGGEEAKEAKAKETDGKEKVVLALWGNQMLDGYTQYLCEKFPDVDFRF